MEEEMKRYLVIPFLVLLVIGLSACSILPRVDPGNLVTENRDVSGFHAVRFDAAGKMSITQGETESLKIEAGKNILPHILTEVVNGVLIIRMDEPRWNVGFPQPVEYTLVVKDLDDFTVSGAGDVKIDDLQSTAMKIDISGAGNFDIDSLQADSLELGLSGAGNVEISNLEVASLDATLGGAGNFDLAGKATDQTALLTGLGSYQAGDLESARVKVQVTGAGGAIVWATELLKVIISGAGSVEYYGSPMVTEDVNGVGSVQSLGNK
jgi:hypothetical protein